MSDSSGSPGPPPASRQDTYRVCSRLISAEAFSVIVWNITVPLDISVPCPPGRHAIDSARFIPVVR